MSQTANRDHLVLTVRDAILRVDAEDTMFGLSSCEATAMAEASVDGILGLTATDAKQNPTVDVPICQVEWDKSRRG